MVPEELRREVARRRTFAIIAHPDAGKTTLTEKLLLHAGAITAAGAVRRRGRQRHTVADWMELERERGISITSAALQFDHAGYRFNLLDTPGHQDFSEDTYRTLLAADSAVMVLDGARGIESQTRKLFAACHPRGLPIITFVNKLDREGCDPLALLDAIEGQLGLRAAPLNWPIGDGQAFRGLYDLLADRLLLFSRSPHNLRPAPVAAVGLADPVAAALGAATLRRLREDAALLGGVGATFDRGAFLRGALTPVLFGSALTGAGVGPLLEALGALAPSPGPRESDRGPVRPDTDAFSGFVFKIQANMDPRHHDRVAFLRVCSGRFRRDMVVHHARLGRTMRATRPQRLFARERAAVEEAFPGDVVGLGNAGLLAIGDTLSEGAPRRFAAIPPFPPEHFALLRNGDVAKQKQFRRGLSQLEDEGAIQVWYAGDRRREPILAAVGTLQFDVVVARLASEYGVAAALEPLPRAGGPAPLVAGLQLSPATALRAVDRADHPVLIFTSDAAVRIAERDNPGVTTVLSRPSTRAWVRSHRRARQHRAVRGRFAIVERGCRCADRGQGPRADRQGGACFPLRTVVEFARPCSRATLASGRRSAPYAKERI